jgi:Protein of unknown function (DUF3102)
MPAPLPSSVVRPMSVLIEQSNSLADLAARIHQEHDAASSAFKSAVGHAIAAGELLLQAKEQLKHGRWLPWLQTNCEIPERTVQAYMRLARLPAEKRNAVADLPLREALSAIRSREQKLADAAAREAEPPRRAEVFTVAADGRVLTGKDAIEYIPSPAAPAPPPTVEEHAGECIEQLDQYLHQLPDAVDVAEVRREIGETLVAASGAPQDGNEEPDEDNGGFLVAVVKNATEKANIVVRNLHHEFSNFDEVVGAIDALIRKWEAVKRRVRAKESDDAAASAEAMKAERAALDEGEACDTESMKQTLEEEGGMIYVLADGIRVGRRSKRSKYWKKMLRAVGVISVDKKMARLTGYNVGDPMVINPHPCLSIAQLAEMFGPAETAALDKSGGAP